MSGTLVDPSKGQTALEISSLDFQSAPLYSVTDKNASSLFDGPFLGRANPGLRVTAETIVYVKDGQSQTTAWLLAPGTLVLKGSKGAFAFKTDDTKISRQSSDGSLMAMSESFDSQKSWAQSKGEPGHLEDINVMLELTAKEPEPVRQPKLRTHTVRPKGLG